LHRYLGLTLLCLLVVISFTGFALAFEREWDALLNPDLYSVAGRAGEVLPPSELVSRVQRQLPRARVVHLPLPGDARRALVLEVEPRLDAAGGQPYPLAYDEVFVDPTSGAVNGLRQWGECCSRANILPLLYKVHNRLLLPQSTGRPLLAGIALSWLLLSAVGVYLALSTGSRRPGRWRRSWGYRRGLAGRARLLQLHRCAGLWAMPLMLTMIITGVAMALDRELTRPLLSALAGPANSTLWEQRATDTGAGAVPAVDFDGALQAGRGFAADWPELGPAIAIDLSHSRGLYRVQFADVQLPGAAPWEVYVDTASAAVAGSTVDAGLTAAILNNRQRLHGGDLLGIGGRLLVAATGGMLALMALTGLSMMLWRRRRAAACRA
jgi:uncharacterized iron-regulated membrane protein